MLFIQERDGALRRLCVKDGDCMAEALQRDMDVTGSVVGPDLSYEHRGAQRYTLLIRAAKLVGPAGEYMCVIRDASESGANVRLFHELPECGNMMLELQNGDQHEMKVVWQEDYRAGLQFAQEANIARILECPSRFAKRPIRINLDISAMLSSPLEQAGVRIRNISQQGAQVTSKHRFAIDQRVQLSADGLREVNAKVRWRRGELFGLVFEDTFQFGDLARIIANMQQDAMAEVTAS